MKRTPGRVLLLALSMVLGSSCATDTEPPRTVALTETGGCGEAFFWATSKSGDLAVTISTDARDRSTSATTRIEFSVPDDAVKVEVLRGHDLAQSFCTDIGESKPTSRETAARGKGEIALAPPSKGDGADPPPDSNVGGPGCGVVGTLQVDGLTADDGTVLDVSRISVSTIGCYSG